MEKKSPLGTTGTRQRIVDQLRRGRAKQSLTQADLADALDVSRATVVSLESGAPSPHLDHLIRALHLVGYELVAVPSAHPLTRSVIADTEPVPARVDKRP